MCCLTITRQPGQHCSLWTTCGICSRVKVTKTSLKLERCFMGAALQRLGMGATAWATQAQVDSHQPHLLSKLGVRHVHHRRNLNCRSISQSQGVERLREVHAWPYHVASAQALQGAVAHSAENVQFKRLSAGVYTTRALGSSEKCHWRASLGAARWPCTMSRTTAGLTNKGVLALTANCVLLVRCHV